MPSDRFLRTALACLMFATLAACGNDAGEPAAGASGSTPAEAPSAAPVLPTDPLELPDFDPESFRAMLADVSASTPVVVNFYGSWCGPCKREAPIFAKMHRKYGESVQFIGVDILDTKDGARRFINEYGIEYPSVFDPSASGDIRSSYGFLGQPATLFFNYGGEESYRYEGEMDEESLERAIRPLLPSA